MTMESKGGDNGQQNFDVESQKKQIEKLLDKRYEDTQPSELIEAELCRLADVPDRSIGLAISEDEAANLSETLQAQKLASRNKIYEWGREHGISRNDEETDLIYLLRILQTRIKTKKQGESPGSLENEDQENLF